MLFTFPSRYWFTIGRWVVLSLTRWSSQIHTGFHGPRDTWELHQELSASSPTGLLPPMVCLSRQVRLTPEFVTPRRIRWSVKWLPQPQHDNGTGLSRHTGLGSSRFARRYSGSRYCFLFLGVLRCFNSPGCLYRPYVFRPERLGITPAGFPHSDIPGSKPAWRFTGAYRSLLRPSSAPSAKASTVDPL